MKTTKRIALIGCGAISENHIKGILAAGYELCALCDAVPVKAEKAIEKYALSGVRVYTDYREMLELEKPFAVHICTPHYLHAEMCVAALEKNIHVLCEKPICISLEQLEDVHRAAEKSQAQLGVCHQNRYEPNMRRLYEMTRGGVRGGFGNVVWKRDAAYYNSGEWRGTWDKEGGGVMINQALHTLDIMQWVCGMPKYVTAHVATDHLSDVMETEDTAMARFTCEDGTVFHFFATVAAETDLPVLMRIRLASGETVEAENDLFACNNALAPTPDRGESVGKREWGAGHRELIADFYRCAETNAPFPIDLSEGEKAVRLILSMYRSRGERVEII
jgi:predicted dehydrogenase